MHFYNLHVIIYALCTLEDKGLKNNHPLSVPLPSTNPVKFYIQVVSWILVHPILGDTISHVVGAEEADVREVSLLRLKCSVAGLNVWAWWRLGRGYLGVFW